MEMQLSGIEAVRSNPGLMDELRRVLAPSYIDAGPLLERELDTNTHIYLLADQSRITAFFMVGWGYPARVGGATAVWLGLSACREADKGRGLVLRLYRRFLRDASAWEAEHGERLLLWATTAHPVIFLGLHRFFADVSPRPDGTCTEGIARLAWELRGHLPGHYRAGPYPLIFRGVARSTLYSIQEVARIEEARKKLDRDLFREWEIDERRGDRIMIICRTSRGSNGGRAVRRGNEC